MSWPTLSASTTTGSTSSGSTDGRGRSAGQGLDNDEQATQPDQETDEHRDREPAEWAPTWAPDIRVTVGAGSDVVEAHRGPGQPDEHDDLWRERDRESGEDQRPEREHDDHDTGGEDGEGDRPRVGAEPHGGRDIEHQLEPDADPEEHDQDRQQV